MNEALFRRKFEELVTKGKFNSLDEINMLYKYLMIVNLEKIADTLSSIEDAFSTIEIEEQ